MARFSPMWDWVGGRTSETAVDAALRVSALTARSSEFRKNPAAMLALAWYYLTGGKGSKDMVILPTRIAWICSRSIFSN